MITVVDVETTFVKDKTGKLDPSPFQKDNKLVSVGIGNEYFCMYHNEHTNFNVKQNHEAIQEILNKTKLLVGHNLKFDLAWLYECGFKYEGRVYDTMIAEYVLLRGLKKKLSLKEICKRRHITQKSNIIDTYLNQDIGFEQIPWNIVEQYGRQDVRATQSLVDDQLKDLKLTSNKNLIATLKMMNEFLLSLIEMERNGIYVDTSTLKEVEEEFIKEHEKLRTYIDKTIWYMMGDTPINPASPEQLSWLIYGRKVKDKRQWANCFNIGIDPFTKRNKKRPRLSKRQFDMTVKAYTKDIYRTKAARCSDCIGKGVYQKYKVNGEPYKNLTKCDTCSGQGVIYHNEDKLAGFRQKPRGIMDTSEGGFKTDKVTLMKLLDNAQPDLVEFIKTITRYSAVDMYLKTFVTGISNHTDSNGFLHPKFMQCVTSTGRLSSRDPNFQNQPRGGTFPIRKVVKSRFENGVIIEIDFAQLEFRTAVFLAQDKQGMEDIKNGVDVHQYTADIIGVSRQDAKAHTFKPLYGGTTGTDNEKRYYSAFKEKYKDIAKWHEQLQTDAIKYKLVRLPNGREYAFPYAQRQVWGGSSYGTQIKNYPVQGFATADIVPIACINIFNMMKRFKLKSKLINTVHDSIVVDAMEDEIDDVKRCLFKGCEEVIDSLKKRYDIDFNIPLDTELKMGYDWLNLKEV
jgi:DNA polymerase I-like protein with 3'-5' exonuclease and polymerase domains